MILSRANPDTIKDEWIEGIETLGEKMNQYIDARKRTTGFDLLYTGTMTAPRKIAGLRGGVLSRRDSVELMRLVGEPRLLLAEVRSAWCRPLDAHH